MARIGDHDKRTKQMPVNILRRTAIAWGSLAGLLDVSPSALQLWNQLTEEQRKKLQEEFGDEQAHTP